MRWFVAVLVALLVAGVAVVVGVRVFGEADASRTPPAFCPADVDENDPQGESELDSRRSDDLLLYLVDEDGMKDMSSQLNGKFPEDFPYRPALVCEYRTMYDDQLSECPTSGGGSIPMMRTSYDYKVYDLPGKELLGVFDAPGVALCDDYGIVTDSKIPAGPDYPTVLKRLAPLLR